MFDKFLSPIVQVNEEKDDEREQTDEQSGSQGVHPQIELSTLTAHILFVIVVPVSVQPLAVFGALLGGGLSLRGAVGVAMSTVGVAVSSVGVTMSTVGVSVSTGYEMRIKYIIIYNLRPKY